MATKRKNLLTPGGIACFVQVFTARAHKEGDAPKYGLVLSFDRKTDISDLEEAVETAAVEKFGSKARQMLQNGKLWNPIRDGSDYEEHGEPFTRPGSKFISFKSDERPGLVDADGDSILDKTEFYSGCLARVSCRVGAFDNKSKGVALYLVNVQKLDDGERLAGNPSAEDEFADAPPAKTRKPAAAKNKRSRDDDDDDDDMV